MEDRTCTEQNRKGRFLVRTERKAPGRRMVSRWLTITMLVAWDGLLLYMIVGCLIEPVYGAAFVAVVSVYLGYQL